MDYKALSTFNRIEDIYSSISIYKSVIIYSNNYEFIHLRDILLKNDYPLTSVYEKGRIFDVDIKHLASRDIDWPSISMVICLDDISYNIIKEYVQNENLGENLNLIIKL